MTIPELRTLLDKAIADPSHENFTEAFREAKSFIHISDLLMTNALQVSKPTIGGWLRGETSVHQAGRVSVLNYLKQRLAMYELSQLGQEQGDYT